MTIKGRKSHKLQLAAENRARHKTSGDKRFIHVDLSWRGSVQPDYGAVSVAVAFMAVSSMLKMSRAGFNRNRGGR